MTTETTTKKTTTALERKLDKDYAESVRVRKSAVADYKESKALVRQMPAELANLRWYVFRKLENKKWYLETWGLSDEKGDEFIKQLKIMGVYGIKSKFRTYNAWEYSGSVMIGDTEVVIKVDGGSKPLNCRVEETKEWREVVSYKAVCEETGEEL